MPPGQSYFAPLGELLGDIGSGMPRLAGVHIPFIEKLPARGRDTLFVYGGKWMAQPCWPSRIACCS